MWLALLPVHGTGRDAESEGGSRRIRTVTDAVRSAVREHAVLVEVGIEVRLFGERVW